MGSPSLLPRAPHGQELGFKDTAGSVLLDGDWDGAGKSNPSQLLIKHLLSVFSLFSSPRRAPPPASPGTAPVPVPSCSIPTPGPCRSLTARDSNPEGEVKVRAGRAATTTDHPTVIPSLCLSCCSHGSPRGSVGPWREQRRHIPFGMSLFIVHCSLLARRSRRGDGER